MKNVARLGLLAAAVILVASTATYAVIHLVLPDEPTTDLTLKEKFPKGFDRQSFDVRAVGFDGQNRCRSPVHPLDPPWKHTNVFYTNPHPTAKQILDANPLADDRYKYTGTPTVPHRIDHDEYEVQRYLGWCDFQYYADAWETTVDVSNHKPVEIQDSTGQPFAYARTTALLAGKGNDQNGTRLLVQGTATKPVDLSLEYYVYAKGSLDRVLDHGIAPVVGIEGTSFQAMFDVPSQNVTKADLFLIPVHRSGDTRSAVPSDAVSLTAVYRMETQDAQLRWGSTTPAKIGNGIERRSDSITVHAASLGEAESKASSFVDDLEAESNAAFLLQKAFRADSHKTAHIRTASSFVSTTRVSLEGAGTARTFEATYSWTVIKGHGTLTSGWSHSARALAEEAAAVTAHITQLGADGLVLADTVATGNTPAAALLAASAALDATGQAQHLEALTVAEASAQALRTAERFVIAAGLVQGAYEWYQAVYAPDLAEQVFHSVAAARIVLETIFSLTPQGAILVAFGHLAQYAAMELIPASLLKSVENGVRAFLGQVPSKTAKDVFMEWVPDLEAFADENDAQFLMPVHYDQAKSVPSPALGLVAVAVASAAFLARRRQLI